MVLFGLRFSDDCLFPDKFLRDWYWVLSYPRGVVSRIELGLIVGVSEGLFVRNPLKKLGEFKRNEMGLV